MKKYPSIDEVYTIQSVPQVGKRYTHDIPDPVVKSLMYTQWYCTEKIDGTNIRIGWDGQRSVEFIGRKNKEGNIPEDHTGVPELLRDTFDIDRVMSQEYPGKPMDLYVEAFGPKLSKTGDWYADEPLLVLLDVRINGFWLEPNNVADVGYTLRIPTAPVIPAGSLDRAIEIVEKGLVSRFGDFPAEGIVAKAKHGLLNRKGERIITKIKTEFFHGKKLKKNAFTPVSE